MVRSSALFLSKLPSPHTASPARYLRTDLCADIFLAVVISATEVGNTRPCAPIPETVGQIHDVGFYSLTSSMWDELSSEALGSPGLDDADRDMFARDTYVTAAGSAPVLEHPCLTLKKIIAGATFYYAMEPQWDISSRLTKRIARTEPWDAAVYDERFVWNEYMVRSLLDFRERLDAQERADIDRCQFIVRAQNICGMCVQLTVCVVTSRCWQSMDTLASPRSL